MNTPPSVKNKIDAILYDLPRYGSYAFADIAAERERIRAILQKILEKRNEMPQLSGFEEKMVAKALNVYEPYVDAAIQRRQIGEVIIRPLHTISSIQPEHVETATGERQWIKSVLKTRYALTMPDELILKLESVRDCNFRIRLEEGFTDPNLPDLVGLAHSDHFHLVPEGYLSRNEEGVPLLFSTARSTVPLTLDMQNVVRIEFANRNHGGELWRHPQYKQNDGYFTCLDEQGFLIRSCLADSKKTAHRYNVKLYDQGNLLFEVRNFQVRRNKLQSPENAQMLDAASIKEIISVFTRQSGASLPHEPSEELSQLQRTWLDSPRAGVLAALGNCLPGQ